MNTKRTFLNSAVALILLASPAILPSTSFLSTVTAQEQEPKPIKEMVDVCEIEYGIDGKRITIQLPHYVRATVTTYDAGEVIMDDPDGPRMKYPGPLTFTLKIDDKDQTVNADDAIFVLGSKRVMAEWKNAPRPKPDAPTEDKPAQK